MQQVASIFDAELIVTVMFVTVMLSVREFTVVGAPNLGAIAHLTKLQVFISKQNRHNSNIDKQTHHQRSVWKLSPCLAKSEAANKIFLA